MDELVARRGPYPGPTTPFGILRLIRVLLIGSVAGPLLAFGLYAVVTYRHAYSAAELAARHQNRILQEHALKAFETVELALRYTDEKIKGLDWQEIETSRRLWQELRTLQESKEQLGSLFVMRPDGSIPLTTRVFPAPAIDFSDRDYFLAQKERDVGFYIGQAYVGKISKAPIFNFSLRRSSSDGTFNGVIGSSAFVEYFQKFYEEINSRDRDFAIGLLGKKGDFLVRYPAAEVGIKFGLDSEFLKRIALANEGVFYAASPVDKIDRLYAYSQVGQFPVYVFYSKAEHSIRQTWYGQLAWAAAIAALFGGAMFWAGSIALQRARTEAAASESLRRTAVSLREEMGRRKRAEASLLQAQRLDAVGRLSSGIAHDFNNLLQIIISSLRLLQRRRDPSAMKQLLAAAEDAAHRGADLTRRLLAFSRQQPLNPEVVDLDKVLKKLRTWMDRMLPESIKVETRFGAQLWPVAVDVSQFDPAVLNLVVNARDAMPAGGTLILETRNVTLDEEEIKAHNLAVPAGPYVCVAVIDDGMGMPPETLARIYEPFFTTKEIGKGSGLGLSQVFGFVKQSNGSIYVESEVGNGTAVRMYLPRAEGEPKKAQGEASVLEPVPATKEVVLVVEDKEEVRKAISNMLEELGYITVSVRNGIEALALLSAGGPVDILLSDVELPLGLNGIALGEQALQIRPSLTVLLASASLEVETTLSLLRKPFSEVELLEKLRELRGTPAQPVLS
ncbi:MAG TPA: ATP-binding protein [Xanthobacteraceae bacterium]|nr:ATP-binding protein [Xanthobacteraceae bacterium]